MYPIDLSGRHALVLGVANHRSLAWAIAQALHQAGASLCLTYAGERLQKGVEELAATLPGTLVHGVAFANKEDLEGSFVATSREGFRTALEVSAYSLVNVTHRVLPLLEKNGGSIVSLTYLAAERAVPSYNVMGSAKAVLEQATRQMAYELGPKNVRVNAVSAGPVSTLAARGIKGFVGMHKDHAERAALKRNITQEEVGKAALFLLSDLASGVTGEVLYVDAGYRIMGV